MDEPLDDHDDLGDGEDGLPDAASGATAPAERSPLDGLSDHELEDRLAHDPASLGSLSIGATNAGLLVNGVQMPAGERWDVIDRAHAWGTRETVDAIVRCIDAVHKQFPQSPKLYIGHISAERGGHLSPHKSHQAGRDADISYYLDGNRRGFFRATKANLDRARTWAFVRALITETDVELILIDTSVQKILKDYAAQIGEDQAFLDDVFQVGGRSPRPLIRHAKGHGNHLHVRFYSPLAQRAGARLHPILAKQGRVRVPSNYVLHRVQKGQTLGIIAKRYGTTVEAIQSANGMRSVNIRAKQVVRIPRPGTVRLVGRPIVVPPRRLPPPRAAAAAAAPAATRGPVE